ncbi:molybdopterin biosynthesis protein MoeA [Pseudoalteromonas sp. S4389]|uniref:radical SAM/SPASM domain-containing protein n=1 Tax=Pseudoalteromonas sp. S4389 TaxID=579556 RepID=UPI001107DECD|nr:radical SAM protein [Pseudoalteromonas sp. S4389]TMO44832.1 molybdopterin biosynthesis protein MoeA [Pseudoalteromonas sp. S4389]
MSDNKIPVPHLPPRLLMDLYTDCNLKCPMCIVHGKPDAPELKGMLKKSMTLANAKKILDEAMPAAPAVGPTLWSEPLMSKDILIHLKSMKMRNMNISMNTNGLLMSKKMSQALIEIGVDSITVSVDATTPEVLEQVRGIKNLDKIKNNLFNLLELRGDTPLPRIGVSLTKQDSNLHQVDEFVDYWVNIVDFVRIGEIFDEGTFPNVDVDHSQRKPCPEIYSTMPIHTDGDVSLCCLDGFKDQIVGNVLEEGVSGVWNSDKLNEIRYYHETGQWDKVPFCKSCERWSSSDYTEEVIGQVLIRRSTEYTFYNDVKKLNNWRENCRHEREQQVQKIDIKMVD